MLFVTGDTYYPTDAGKLFAQQEGFPVETLQKTDYVIVLGDFGLFWKKRDKHNAKNMRQIQDLPYTLLFLDGNHVENPPIPYTSKGNDMDNVIQQIWDENLGKTD